MIIQIRFFVRKKKHISLLLYKHDQKIKAESLFFVNGFVMILSSPVTKEKSLKMSHKKNDRHAFITI